MAPLDDSVSGKASEASDCANHAWGYLATGVKNAADCISSCRENFLTQMIPKDQQFDQLCKTLQGAGNSSSNPFLALYCCDSQLCGVNHLGEGGRDPNVNWIVNSCNSMGYGSLTDPGPPRGAYTCGQSSENQTSSLCVQKDGKKNKNKPTGFLQDIIAPEETSTPEGTASNTATKPQQTAVNTLSQTVINISGPTQVIQTTTNSSNLGGLNTAEANANGSAEEIWRPDGLTRGIKVTIGLASFVVFMIICALIFCLFRERSKRKARRAAAGKFMSPPQTGNRASRPVSQFPTPVPPPARLRERRFLPPLKHLESTKEKEETSSEKEIPNFPESPVYCPTHYKLSPRRESLMLKRVSDPTKESQLVKVPGEREIRERQASTNLSESPTLNVSMSSPTLNPPVLAPPALGTSVLSHASTLNSSSYSSPSMSSPARMSAVETIPSLLNSDLLNNSPLISPAISSPAVISPPTLTTTRNEYNIEPLVESRGETPIPPPRNPAHHALSLSELVRALPASMRDRQSTSSEGFSTRPTTPHRKRQTIDRPLTTLGNPSLDSVLTPEPGDHRRTGSSSREQRKSW